MKLYSNLLVIYANIIIIQLEGKSSPLIVSFLYNYKLFVVKFVKTKTNSTKRGEQINRIVIYQSGL